MNQSKLLDQWVAAVAPDEPHKLHRRLQWDNLDRWAFEDWLKAEGAEADLHAEHCHAALEVCRIALQEHWQLPLLPYKTDGQRPFQDIWWPVRLELEQWLRDALKSPDWIQASVFGELADAALDRLCYISESVLWGTFSSGRGPGAMLLAHLGADSDGSGPPVRELYERFVQQQRRDGLGHLLAAYPVLGRLIGSVVSLWQIATVEMLQRIEADRLALEQSFGILRAFPLVSVKQGLSDPHRGGRTVAILSFTELHNSAIAQVVYKPKDMAVDATYQALLKDLNANSDLKQLRTLSVHACNGYGYMEYVEHQLSSSEEALSYFYTQAGRLTAILHMLGCTDCHHENMIANGDQLLLVDTETLLESELRDQINMRGSSTRPGEPSTLKSRFQRSVLRSGLLPQWIFMDGGKLTVDISALGIAPPSEHKHMAPGWLGINSDGMLPGLVSFSAQIPTSLPVGIGAINPFHRYLDLFCAGFASQAEALIAQRERWLQPDSALSRFAGLQRRIVLRATRVYFALQRQQLEPEALRSPQAQALKLEQLARSFLLTETRPFHWPVFAAERRQMQQLDIPFFSHEIDGNAVQLDADGTQLTGLIKTSGLQAALERLCALDQEEIAFQLSVIRGAVQSSQLRVSTYANASDPLGSQTQPAGSITDLEVATRISEQLLALAIRDPQGHVEWLGMDLGADGERFSFGPVGLSLYGGSIGIACLLKRLESQNVTLPGADEARYAILRPLRDLAEQTRADGRRRWWRDQPLGLSGCGGVLLALQQLGEQPLAETLLADALPRFLEADRQLDLIGGCAGLIGALLKLGTPVALELAVVAGQHLLIRQNEAGAWSTSPHQPALLGYSHGTAGYVAALAHLHARTGEDDFAQGAQSALVYERARFNAGQGNWPDLRIGSDAAQASSFMVSWCHGAPGIGLSRACLWGTNLWDEQCAEEIGVALATTADMTTPGADHLCCGSLGLMVVLRTLASGPWPLSTEKRAHARAAANNHRDQALQRCTSPRLGLRCSGAQEGNLMLPGFFTGLSGMGLALLNDQTSQSATLNLLCAGLNPALRLDTMRAR